MLTVIHTELRALQPVAQKCIYSSHGWWARLSPSKLPIYSPFPTVYTRFAQIFHKCRSQLKIPSARWVTQTRFHTQDPQLLSRHHTKFSRPGHLARCIYVPLVSALRVGQVCDIISLSLIAASWTPSRYMVSLLLFSESQPIQPTGPSKPHVFGCSSLPAFLNYMSQQLAFHIRWIFLQGPLQYCSVFRLHVLCATLREPDGRDVLLLEFNRGWARLKAVSGLRWPSVACVHWTQTEMGKLQVGWKQDIRTYNCTFRRVREIAKSNC